MKIHRQAARKHLWLIGGIVLASIASLIICMPKPLSATNPNEKLVTIHDNYASSEQTIVTTAGTVGDALKKAKVSIASVDKVEPSADTPLAGGSYNVNIYHARPVTVVDGANRISIVTPYQSAADIAKAAGLTIYPEDILTLSQIDDFVSDGGMGLKLTVTRATPINLVLYGQPTLTHTMAKTVGDMLAAKGIKLEANDGTSVPLSTPITPDMTVEVWRNGVQTQTNEEPLPFTTRQIQAPDQPIGYKQIQTQGVNGKQLVTYQINMQNGHEVSRTKIQSVVTEPMVEQVEVIGTRLPAGSHQDWMSAAGMSSNNYGYIDFIFSHESHWNPAAVSRNGYVGLGQTSRTNLSSACSSWQSNPVCQIQYFNGYASRYGGWAGAYSFWKSHGWW